MRRPLAVAGAAALVAIVSAPVAQADPITPACLSAEGPSCFKPNEVATGTSSNSDFPFLIVEVEDQPPLGGSPTVNITFQASKEDPNEFIGRVFLNLDPDIDPSALQFTFNGSTADPSGGTPTSLKQIKIKAKANGVTPARRETNMFDLRFGFPTAGGPRERRLNGLDRVQLLASCLLSRDPDCGRFDEESFDFLSVNKKTGLADAESFRICEHERGITPGQSSGTICGRTPETEAQVPAPASLFLLGVGLMVSGYSTRLIGSTLTR